MWTAYSKVHSFVAWAIAIVGLLASSRAEAQSIGFAVDRLEPAAAGSEWFSLESLNLDAHMRGAASMTSDLALRPVVVYDREGNPVVPLVDRQLILHVGAALVVWHRVRFDISAPLALWQDGRYGQAGNVMFAPPTGEVVGDLRLGADVVFYGRPGEPFTAAAGARVFLPSGHQAAFTGDGGVRLWPAVALAGEVGRIVWAARVGYHVRPTYKCGCSLAPGDELTFALAGGYRPIPELLVGPELYGSSAVEGGRFGKAVASPIELLLGGHYTFVPYWTFSLGAAPGLTNGGGSPSWRFVASLQYSPALTGGGAPPPTRGMPPSPTPESGPDATPSPAEAAPASGEGTGFKPSNESGVLPSVPRIR